MAFDTTAKTVELRQHQWQTMIIPIVGMTPLLLNRFSDTAKAAMWEKQTKQAAKGRVARDAEREFESAQYRMADGGAGLPADAFRKAAVRAGLNAGVKMTVTKAALLVEGELVSGADPVVAGTLAEQSLVRVLGPAPKPLTSRVVFQQTTSLAIRPRFWPWAVELEISFDGGVFSAEQVLDLVNRAGTSTGVGSWRPENGGKYGRFRVSSAAELRAIKKQTPKVA